MSDYLPVKYRLKQKKIKHCKICKKPFIALHNALMLCSDSCKKKNNREKQKKRRLNPEYVKRELAVSRKNRSKESWKLKNREKQKARNEMKKVLCPLCKINKIDKKAKRCSDCFPYYSLSESLFNFLEKNLKKCSYYKDKSGYIFMTYKNRRLQFHRFVFALHNNKFNLKIIDHINEDKTDNHPLNLQEVSIKENNLLHFKRRNKCLQILDILFSQNFSPYKLEDMVKQYEKLEREAYDLQYELKKTGYKDQWIGNLYDKAEEELHKFKKQYFSIINKLFSHYDDQMKISDKKPDGSFTLHFLKTDEMLKNYLSYFAKHWRRLAGFQNVAYDAEYDQAFSKLKGHPDWEKPDYGYYFKKWLPEQEKRKAITNNQQSHNQPES